MGVNTLNGKKTYLDESGNPIKQYLTESGDIDSGKTLVPYGSPQMQDTRSQRAKTPDFTPPVQPPPTIVQSLYKLTGLPQPEAIARAVHGINLAREGNPLMGVAGGENLGQAVLQNAFSPLQGLSELAGRAGLGGVASALNSPFDLLSKTGTGVSNALLDLTAKGGYAPGIGVIPPKLGLNERQYQELKRGTGETAGTIAQLAIPEAIGGTAKYIRNAPARGISKGMELFDEALPVASKELTRPSDLRNMIPYMKEEIRKQGVTPGNRENSIVRQSDERVFKNIEDRVYKTRQNLIQRNANEVIPNFGSKVASEVETLRNIYTKNIDLLKDQSILDEAQKWQNKGSATLSEAADFVHHLNADLNTLYKKTMAEQVATETSAKPIAEMEKAARAIREVIVDKLNDVDNSGNYYRKLSEDYGSASKLRFAAERNTVASERPMPPILERLGERIGTSGNAYATIKAPVLFPKLFSANRKLQTAYGKFLKYGGDIVEPRFANRPPTPTSSAPPNPPSGSSFTPTGNYGSPSGTSYQYSPQQSVAPEPTLPPHILERMRQSKQQAYSQGAPYGSTGEAYTYGLKLNLPQAYDLWKEYKANKEGWDGSTNQLRGEAVHAAIAKDMGIEPKSFSPKTVEDYFKSKGIGETQAKPQNSSVQPKSYATPTSQIDAIGNEKVQFNPENVQQPTSSIKNVDLHRDLTNIVNLAARKAFGKSLEEARTEHYKEAETFGNYKSAKARTTSDWNRKVERELGGVLTSPEFINELQKQGFNVDNEGKFRIATPTKSYSIPIENAIDFLKKMKSKSIQNLFRSKDLGGTLSYLTNNLPRNIA